MVVRHIPIMGLRRHFLIILALFQSILSLHAEMDAEELLTWRDEAFRAYEVALNKRPAEPAYQKRSTLKRDSFDEDKFEARRRWFAQRYAGSELAVKVSDDRVSELFEAREWEKFFPAVIEVLDQYPAYVRLRAKLLYMLARVVGNKDLPAAERKAAFEILIARARHAPVMLSMTGNYLASDSGLSPEQQYRAALRGAEVAEVSPRSRDYVWRFLAAWSKAAPDETRLELESFLQTYPEESRATREAQELLLQANDDSETLKTHRAETAAAQSKVRQLCDQIDKAAAAGDWEAVRKDFEQLAQQPVWAIEIPWWGKFVADNGEAIPGELVKRAIEIVPGGVGGDELKTAVLRRDANYRSGEGVRLILAALDKYADDIQREGSVLRGILLRMAGPLDDENLRMEVYRKMADIGLRMEMKDAAAEFLFDVAKFQIITDEPSARALLKEAAALAPGTEASINANWLLALLDGKLGVVSSLAAKNTLPGVGSEPPEVALPAVSSPSKPSVAVQDGVYSLLRQNVEDNLAQWHKRVGTPSRSSDLWEPESLPASLVVPLEKETTLRKVGLRLAAPSKFVVTLLDGDGRKLAKVGRDWPFWDPGDLAIVWPDSEQILEFPPVAGARFVRIDLYESMTDRPAIEGVEAYGTPFAAEGAILLDPQKLPAGAQAVDVTWQADLPKEEVVYTMASESVVPYPLVRWFRPWTNKVMRNNLGLAFRGENPRLVANGGPGKLFWSVNEGSRENFEQASNVSRNAPSAELPVKVSDSAADRQMLRVGKEWLNGRAVTSFDKLIVDGEGKAGVKVRFGDGSSWEPWQGPFFDNEAKAAATHPAKFYQLEIVLDARAVQGNATPQLSALKVETIKEPFPSSERTIVKESTFLPEHLDEVAEALKNRRTAVVYSKAGTKEEYDLARRLAERAGVYLVSDDVGLNLNTEYYGPLLVVGTPRSNRFARQLIGMSDVWNDQDFLNNEEGVVSKVQDVSGDTFFFVTGDSPSAVKNAGQRLLDRVPQYEATDQAFRVIPSHSLEVLYPWQSHAERQEPESFSLKLGVNDRRSLQFGIASNLELSTLKVSASDLLGPDGSRLSAPTVRAVGGYEWMYFFGDLRLPNLLITEPVLPVPAYTTQGFWVTVRTRADTKPGIYKGAVEIVSGDFSRTIPVQVEVLPVRLPDQPRIDTFSYASVPWWYRPGTEAYDEAARALAQNECEKRVNTVNPDFVFSWKAAPSELPVRFAIGEPDASLDQLKWTLFTLDPKKVPAGKALFVEFRDKIQPAEIGGGFFMDGSEVQLSAIPGPAFLPRKPVMDKAWAAVRFPTTDADAQRFRFEASDGKPFEVGVIRAFLDKDIPIVSYDFSHVLREMDIIEEVYRTEGMSLPNFRLHVPNVLGRHVAQSLFGVGHWHGGGSALSTDFTRQLRDQLSAKGRGERTILKVGDEPRTLGEWAEVARPFREGGLRVMTAHYSGRPDVKDAVGVMNPWCPNFEHDVFDPVIRDRQKAGDRMWWYQCGVPPTRLTGRPVDNLPIYWLTAKWDLDGVANYAALGAKESGPEGSPVPFRYDHGMAYRMNYLPDGTLVDTPRRELEAEGIKDYTLIEFVRDQIAVCKKEGRSTEAQDLEKRLNAVIDSVATSIRGYPTASEPWLTAREQLYNLAVESLQNSPKS